MTVERVEGKTVTILFDGARCIHSRQCVLLRPDVFVPNVEGEWIHPDRALASEIAELAHRCPSGAIRYEARDGTGESAPRVNVATIRENGPIALHASIALDGTDANEVGFRVTLCRCGASSNKPFCDGSHVKAGFAASGEPATGTLETLEDRGGQLMVEPRANGPLHLTGSLEIVSGTGRTVGRATDTWLCRCGQSASKPYCDGTHRRVGFEAPGRGKD